MKKTFLNLILLSMSLGAITTSCSDETKKKDDVKKSSEEIVLVANRAGASLSFINLNDDNKVTNLDIQGSKLAYPVYVKMLDKIYVGDSGKSEIHVINPQTKSVEMSISVKEGVLHMWADEEGKQLWVVGGSSKTLSVIDLSKNEVIKEIILEFPPHDVFVSHSNKSAYVSLIRAGEESDILQSYNTETFNKIEEITIGKDPHLFYSPSNKILYVASIPALYALNSTTLATITQREIPGAHGIYLDKQNKHLFIASLTGKRLYSVTADDKIEIISNIEAEKVTEELLGPHNVVLNDYSSKMFITNYGDSSDKVSVYKNNNGALSFESTIIVGKHPFGITYYKRDQK